jgi:hypothetical protein
MHFFLIVDCPDMHGQAGTMGPSNEPSINEGNFSRVSWDLKAVALGNFAADSEACSPHPSNTPRPHRCAHLASEEGSEVIKPFV